MHEREKFIATMEEMLRDPYAKAVDIHRYVREARKFAQVIGIDFDDLIDSLGTSAQREALKEAIAASEAHARKAMGETHKMLTEFLARPDITPEERKKIETYMQEELDDQASGRPS